MEIKSIAVSKLVPAPYNPRVELRPGDAEYERLRRSLDEFGCVEPLVWNRRTGHLVGGHQRLGVLLAQGATRAEVSVVDLPLEKEKALNLALNRISGSWDQAKLAALLEELTAIPDFDLEVTGFDRQEALEVMGRVDVGAGQEESFDVLAALAEERPVVTRPADLPASARLVRVWPAGSGTRHEVTVIEAGKAYEYRGTRYSSLTPIAREITGTHWSGPRFFGLTARHGPARPGGGTP